MYTANDALNELDKFPAFKRELVRALELSQRLSSDPGDYAAAFLVVERMSRLASMINLRASQDEAA